MYSPYALLIYTDGSALKNPGKEVGLGGIAEFPEHMNREPEKIFSISYDSGTNQTMELRACIKALEYIRAHAVAFDLNHAVIITDSQYVYDNQGRAEIWKKNNWRTASGGPVANYKIWNEFIIARSKVGIRTEIKWRKGKKSQILNDVDRLAKLAAAGSDRRTDFSYNRGKIGRRVSSFSKSCSIYPANDQSELVRVYGKKDVSTPGKSECKVKFETYSEEVSDFHDGYFAFSPNANELHRGHCYRMKFNADVRYPIIISAIEVDCPKKLLKN